MASTINSTSVGSGGLVSTGDDSGQLELQTDGTTRVTINSSGNATFAGDVSVTGSLSTTGGIPTPLVVKGNATAGAELRLPEDTDNGSNYVALKAADSIASNVTFTLPAADGTSGQVLQTNGSGTLSFATPAGGSLIYITSVTASTSATLDFTNIGSTYDAYMFTFTKLVPSSSTSEFLMRTSTNNGSSYDAGASDYAWSGNSNYNGNTSADSGSTGQSYIWLAGLGASPGNISTEGGINGVVYLYKPSASAYCVVQSQMVYTTNTGAYGQNYTGGQRKNNSDVDAVRFYMASGTIDSGVVRLYGIKNS